ncbi:hypothetical protein TCAL_03467 [Tigriopus californicus]|uniref:Neurotransmitter-gated ion-channel ligand-binding domain-containing protein n=1 Tax=Tigriopus californicus TaxID=6832 RepID=A0A553NQA9_TIGCA|nr:gamma-aminobutyric acid receptor subunit beta-like [Tigriopus californicus]TRY67589.1 hypothetical protein TCAL_03467 [Tigriopus californicus]|eukprot:TCALIF_03467-PA protein Name:"Similar to Rdl Gamma-aminobutyric acid receptor subunit beta (Musca domestica)" AED:0.00 eAED:0.00 QI:106/1/1/1/0.8/0.83/6/57/260
MKVFILTLLALLSLTDARHFSYKAREQWLAQETIPSNYDKRFRPPPVSGQEDAPVKINVTMYIQELSICPHHQQMVMGGYFRQFWVDPRLAMTEVEDKDETILTLGDMFVDTPIWIPDTFVVNSKNGLLSEDAPETKGRSFLRVKADGSVLGSTRFRSKLICPMSKKDKELTCSFHVESFASRATELSYVWKDFEADSMIVSDQAIELLKNNGWKLVESTPINDYVELAVGNYSRVSLNIKLEKIEGEEESDESSEEMKI